VAAGVYRAFSLRRRICSISKTLLSNAGVDAQWQALTAEIRRGYHRKSGFMPGFERMVRDAPAAREPSFLEVARNRWASRSKALSRG
jgi:hypothetical protein